MNGCNVVVGVLWVVARVLCGCWGIVGGCQVVLWSLGCCNVVVGVLRVVARLFCGR